MSLPIPTDGEMEVLSALWRLGPATVREIHQELGRTGAYTTTLKQMQVMLDKGLLKRNEAFRSHIYEAVAPKEQTRRQIAGHLLRSAFEGSAGSLVLGALESQPPSREELDEIRAMLDRFAKKQGGRK